MMTWHYGWGVGGWVLMSLLVIAFWAVVVGAGFLLLRPISRGQPVSRSHRMSNAVSAALDPKNDKTAENGAEFTESIGDA
jgi:hypothetical protein